MAENLVEQFTRQDRDLIIKLDAKVDNLIDTVRDIKDNTVSRVSRLETEKANQKDFTELFNRVDLLENWQAWSKGIFAVMTVVVSLVVYIYLNDLGRLRSDLLNHEAETQKAFQNIQK